VRIAAVATKHEVEANALREVNDTVEISYHKLE